MATIAESASEFQRWLTRNRAPVRQLDPLCCPPELRVIRSASSRTWARLSSDLLWAVGDRARPALRYPPGNRPARQFISLSWPWGQVDRSGWIVEGAMLAGAPRVIASTCPRLAHPVRPRFTRLPSSIPICPALALQLRRAPRLRWAPTALTRPTHSRSPTARLLLRPLCGGSKYRHPACVICSGLGRPRRPRPFPLPEAQVVHRLRDWRETSCIPC